MVADRRRFLTQSLAHADAEFLAGDLADADYLALRQRDLARLTALEPEASPTTTATASMKFAGTMSTAGTAGDGTAGVATLAAERAPGSTGPERASRWRGRNKWFLAGAVVCFAAALIVAIPLFSSQRLPGQHRDRLALPAA